MNRKSIAFIGTPDYPIPAIHGGAIQTLVTGLINQNEENGLFDIVIYTIDDPNLYNLKYNFTNIFGIKLSINGKIRLIIRKILRRLTKNKICYKSEYMHKINEELVKKDFDYIIFETTDKEIVQLDPDIKKKSKILYHIHADYLKNSTDRINQIAELVDVFVGVSDFISNSINAVEALADSTVLTLKNAISQRNFSQDEKLRWRKHIRKKYGFSDDDTVFIYCSRLSPEKGCLELEKALVKLAPSAKLLVVGGANFNSNKKTKYLAQLHEIAEQNKGRIIFTGFVNHETVVQYMSAADIAVVPSVCNEACSLTLLEFRSCGLPTIATKIGGIPEFTDENATVLVNFDTYFVDELSKAMNRVMNDYSFKVHLQNNSNKNLSQYYYAEYYQKFVELLNRVDDGKNIK